MRVIRYIPGTSFAIKKLPTNTPVGESPLPKNKSIKQSRPSAAPNQDPTAI